MEGRMKQIEAACAFIQEKIGTHQPEIGLILGSGLGVLADEITDAVRISYGDIPHFPVSTVEGHKGELVVGTLEGRTVAAMQGRFHYYEGYTMQQVTLPVYVMRQLGISSLVVTNACGGMNRAFAPGDLILIGDHINWTGDHPLIGANLSMFGPRFPDMSDAYTAEYRKRARTKAVELGIAVKEGVYAGISGPSYMTPAELTMLARLGADAVGMSTVPEVIAASHAGLKVLGIACVTDMAIGEELAPLTHEQVMEVANRTRPRFLSLVKAIMPDLD
ncbi:purine-nucleoside phosphorylase [Aneurinibacillus soli]|uniref:Purine nucleoside phosphorylase n=1 Tax=Aneurinibacillus soli TaxID=1500254 RepID=A0A0U5B443_9BACL|nr:purine-nucleoside phosphorylase [Aneurinibacillus soli]PYE62822.1 purine-nucleoside phosphorylase [Aneurinibacillus soli]BAU29120.1 Purine nucleoside phosphorylase 1 [Aneurinibacillus soli]